MFYVAIIDLLLKEFIEFYRTYLNDIIVVSNTFKLYIKYLTLILNVLKKHLVSLEPKKVYVTFPKISLLG
ncbi:hypothetical protein N7537_002354 [Penicillium hordei]|uniref:Reverse transcriptase domain-containing protein n=1 Tax=Penicillium hordei TaxID=40994 RepID=A0AAD6EHA1_9EURO|nr:uncharacterized protein N7537_002354 [Penicillium hordei]KAJ5617240.1 hypothetical protein N7537_002354 [Penicillium hordei]